MSLCSYCSRRKGKRPCPALGGSICSACCGAHRLSRISCPSHCHYLDSGGDYQERRLGEQLMPRRREFYHELEHIAGPKGVALFNLIEVATYRYFEGRRDGHDAEVIAALQSLRRALSPLYVLSSPLPIFAEYLKKEYEDFLKDHPREIAERDEAPHILDRAVAFVTAFSGADFQSRRFLNGLLGYVNTYHPRVAEQLRAQRDQRSILLPSTLLPSTPLPPMTTSGPHVHGPGCEHPH